MQARAVSASLCYPSTSAICTWARTWLAAPGPPWKWGGGSVASAGPAPQHVCALELVAVAQRKVAHKWSVVAHGLEPGQVVYSPQCNNSCCASVHPVQFVCAKDMTWARHSSNLLTTSVVSYSWNDYLRVVSENAWGPEACLVSYCVP